MIKRSKNLPWLLSVLAVTVAGSCLMIRAANAVNPAFGANGIVWTRLATDVCPGAGGTCTRANVAGDLLQNRDGVLSYMVAVSPSPSPGQHLQFNASGVWTPVAAGTATVAIGSPVSGGTSTAIPYVDGSGNLAQDPTKLGYTPGTQTLYTENFTTGNDITCGGNLMGTALGTNSSHMSLIPNVNGGTLLATNYSATVTATETFNGAVTFGSTVNGSTVCTQATGCSGGGGSLQVSYALGNRIIVSPSPSPITFDAAGNLPSPYPMFVVEDTTAIAPVSGHVGWQYLQVQSGPYGGIAGDLNDGLDSIITFMSPQFVGQDPGDVYLNMGHARAGGLGGDYVIKGQTTAAGYVGGPVDIEGGCDDNNQNCAAVIIGGGNSYHLPFGAPVAPYLMTSGPDNGGEFSFVCKPVSTPGTNDTGFLWTVPDLVPSPNPRDIQISNLSLDDTSNGNHGLVLQREASTASSHMVLRVLETGVTVWENILAGRQIADTFTAAWQTVTYTNSYTNYGNGTAATAYWKDPIGVVHLEGCAAGGTAGAAVFTLPAGFRPSTLKIIAAVVDTNAVVANDFVKISSAGVVQAAGGGTTNVCFDSITFPGEN